MTKKLHSEMKELEVQSKTRGVKLLLKSLGPLPIGNLLQSLTTMSHIELPFTKLVLLQAPKKTFITLLSLVFV